MKKKELIERLKASLIEGLEEQVKECGDDPEDGIQTIYKDNIKDIKKIKKLGQLIGYMAEMSWDVPSGFASLCGAILDDNEKLHFLKDGFNCIPNHWDT